MIGKNAVIVSSFNYYDIRVKHIEIFLKKHFDKVTYITSDFDHISKSAFTVERLGTIQVRARPYKKNLSIRRMLSHFCWAKAINEKMNDLNPDFLFIMLPPNSLAKHVAKYANRNGAVLVFDIYDLWPETYPLSKSVFFSIPFYFWGRMRNKHLRAAKAITFECGLFRNKLARYVEGVQTSILYPALSDSTVQRSIKWEDKIVNLAYLGSINNIIDIRLISRLIEELCRLKPVRLHIIGSGENRNEFIRNVENAGAIVVNYGLVYDYQQKQDILDMCRYGLNIMRDSVCVGLTMKSIDYFMAGLPVINNIGGDTAHLVEKYEAGYNLNNILQLANKISEEGSYENITRRNNARRLYLDMFTPEAFQCRLNSIMQLCYQHRMSYNSLLCNDEGGVDK